MGVTDWNADGDFAEVLDTLEPATLSRAGCDTVDVYPRAWRFVVSETTIGERSAKVVRSDAVWHLPIDAGKRRPEVGDRLIDGGGVCWMLRSVAQLRAATRFRCGARSTRLAADDAVWLRLERAVWGDQGSGAAIVEWRPERLAVSAVIETLSALAAADSPATEEVRVRITLAEQVDAGAQHRLVTSRGEVYQLVDRVAVAAPGDLPAVQAVRTITG